MLGRILDSLGHLSRNCSGATALEYALIVVFISILVVGWAELVGASVIRFFTDVNNGF